MIYFNMKCEKCGKDFQISESKLNDINNKIRPCYCNICYTNYIADNTFIKCKCDKCNNLFQISKRNFNQRKYRKTSNLCDECMKIKIKQQHSEISKSIFKTMSEEKKDLMRKNQSIAAKHRCENMTPEEIDKLNNQLSEMRNIKNQNLSSMTDEERKKLYMNFGYNSLSSEQKKIRNQKISTKAKARFNNMDNEEINKIVDNLRFHLKKYLENETVEQREKRLNKLSKSLKEYYSNLPEDEINRRKTLLIEAGNKYIQNETEEQRKDRCDKSGKTYHENYLNKSIEERQARSNRSKKQWENISDEEKKLLLQPMFDGLIKWKSSLTDDELFKLYNNSTSILRNYYINESEDDKNARILKISESLSNYWSYLSPEEKEIKMNNLREGWNDWFNNLTVEEKEKRSYEKSIKEQERWANLTDEQRAEIMMNRLLSAPSKYDNNFNKRFVEAFNHSILNDSYILQPEYITSNETTHIWDYGIFDKQTNTLQMVVDLDGAYFHADNCDYDGLHSVEEYDEKRSMSVPDGIKIFIINELLFRNTFQEMVKNIISDYNEYIDYLFNRYRNIPFPEQCYKSIELINSFKELIKMNCNDKYHKSLSLNTRLGDRIINHFHHSIYRAHTKGKPSPYEAWYNDELLKKCIENRILYQSYLNPNKILQGFNISKIAPKVSVFSAGRAKMIINKYLNQYDEIFDPFSGFSGRMLGAISLGKQYIGSDINEIHIKESNEIIDFLKRYFNISAFVIKQNILQSSGNYQCLFTCPPYNDKEIWIDHYNDINKSCDEWIDICLEKFKCKSYVFIVDNTIKYSKYIVDTIYNKSHYNHNEEYILYIN